MGNWLYAVILSFMPLSCIVTYPRFRRLSDFWQCKTLILIGYWLNLLIFILSWLAISSGHVIWLVIGNMINGFAGNAQPLSTAAIDDLSQGRNRANRCFGFDACSMALATVVGLLVSYLSNRIALESLSTITA